jgi:hypothetical protein
MNMHYRSVDYFFKSRTQDDLLSKTSGSTREEAPPSCSLTVGIAYDVGFKEVVA